MAHESHVTWPVTAPPGFVHFVPCLLPLCPLRDDLIPSMRTLRHQRQMGDQLGGSAMSSGTREMPIEVLSSDEKSDDTDTDMGDDADKQDREDLDPLPDYEDLDPVPESETFVNTTYLSGESDRSRIIAGDSPRVVPPFFGPDVFELPLNYIFSDGGCNNTHTSATKDQYDARAMEDEEDTTVVEDQENTTSAFELDSRPSTGPYFHDSGSDSDTLVGEWVRVTKETPPIAVPLNYNTIAKTTTITPPTDDTMKSPGWIASSPPGPFVEMDNDDKPLLSLSHPGTLGKRNRTTSPNEESDNKRRRREDTPDLDEFVSILQRKRQVNNWDRRPLDVNDHLPISVTPKWPPLFQITKKSQPMQVTPDSTFSPQGGSTSPRTLPFTPTGPRAFRGSSLVCFFWYHQGHCKAHRRMKCRFKHTLPGPAAKVNRPPYVSGHDPDCRLPLCPIRLGQTDDYISNDVTEQGSSPCFQDESFTPSKSELFTANAEYSSSPRDGISETRSYLKGPKFNERSRYQLPQLTGASRERFKLQKKTMEKWQADNGITTTAKDAEKVLEEKRDMRRLGKQLRRQKKEDMRTISMVPLSYEDDVSRASTPDYIATPTKRSHKQKKKAMSGRHASSELLNADGANGGRIQTFDEEAELYSDEYQPLDGFPDSDPEDDPRDENESVRERGEKALKMVELLKEKTKRKTRRSLSAAQGRGRVSKKEGGMKLDTRLIKKKVDYELPTGEGRLDWDTDLVRRLFGEIE